MAIFAMIKNLKMTMLEIKDICQAFFEGYIHAKATEFLLKGKILSSQLDAIKDTAIKCMKSYIDQQELTDIEKQQFNENYKQWAESFLIGIKARLRSCGKLSE